MLSLRLITLIFAGAIATRVISPSELEASQQLTTHMPVACPVTLTPVPAFVPPGHEHDRPLHGFYYGTNKLWVLVWDSPWRNLPLWDIGYRNKIVWWSEGYYWKADPKPALEISGRRLDGAAPPLVVTGANGSYKDSMGSFIMSGVNFPTTGCWEITGQFQGTELKFVVSVQR
jgi:hypothetical protein